MRVKIETAMRERDAANEQFQSLVAEREAMRIKLEAAIEERATMKEEPPVDNHCVGVANQTMADRRKNAVTIQTLMSSECRYPGQAMEREREKCPSLVISRTSGGAPPVRIKDVRQVAEKPPVAAEVTIRTEGETTAGDEKQQLDPPPGRHAAIDVRMKRVKGRVKEGGSQDQVKSLTKWPRV
eukprot:GHVR01164281.1.p1 GENE.GHVR01164281.1~~GHVR01164281.1.p1  ORF type:complete len:183 (+),score=43.75 GHVR01164281.1:51-599(+)